MRKQKTTISSSKSLTCPSPTALHRGRRRRCPQQTQTLLICRVLPESSGPLPSSHRRCLPPWSPWWPQPPLLSPLVSWFLFLRVRLLFLGLGTVSVEYRTRAFQREDEKTGSSGGFSRRGFSLTFPFIQGSASEEHTASCPPAPPSGPARPRRSGSLTFTGRLRVPRTLSPEPSSCEPRCCDTCGGERAVKAAEREPSGASGGGVKLEPAGNMSEFWHKLGCCVVEKPQPVSVPAPPLENQLPELKPTPCLGGGPLAPAGAGWGKK